MFVCGFSAVQTITNFGGVPQQGVHAVFQLGKPSFKKENLLSLRLLLKQQQPAA